ncbi:MAG: hypothetical protein JNN13_08370 [Planctomycetes bacterium]|nr:hypothetical protein [Planctomycetota bacterium]
MKTLVTMTAAMLAVAASAQSPLNVNPTGGGLYGWNPTSPDHQTFFDLTVSTTVTLQALAVPLSSPVGQQGTFELWMTNPGITTFVGNETNAANWHQASAGTVVANGTTGTIASLTCTSCQETGGVGLVLQPGTYGCAVRYGNVANLFYAVPTLPNTFSTAELSVTGGAIQYNAFVSTPSGPAGTYLGWNWYGSIYYAVGAVPHSCAETATYGNGCVERFGSIFEEYTSAAAATTALNGRSLSYVPNGIGAYDVVPGIAAYGYVAPSGAALQIAASDDGEATQPLTIPFVYPGGIATELYICSNGYVSLGGSNLTLSGPNWVPEPPPFLNATNTAWWIWHDLNPTETGSGFIWFEEDAGTAQIRVTWLNVESYPDTAANPSTFQMVFDPITGIVTLNFVALDTVGGSQYLQGDDWLVGYSPAGASPNPGMTDLAALMTAVNPPVSLPPSEVFPLALAASAKPMIGTTIDLETTNGTGLSLGINFIGTVQVNPGIDLVFLGAPGCFALMDINSGTSNVISNLGVPGLSMNISLPIPNVQTLAGAVVYSQSIWLDATANALGIITSNGVSLKVGNY